jgi:hypothetical protein
MHKEWAERHKLSAKERLEAVEQAYDTLQAHSELQTQEIKKLRRGQARLAKKVRNKNAGLWGTSFAIVAVIAIAFYWHLGMVTENTVLKANSQMQKIVDDHEKAYHTQ